jgi:hypothetical protein
MAVTVSAEYEAVVAVEHIDLGPTELSTSSELHIYYYSGGTWHSGLLYSTSSGSSISDLVVSEEGELAVYWKQKTLSSTICYKSTDFTTKSLVDCRYHPGTSGSGEVRYDDWDRVVQISDCGSSFGSKYLWDRPTDTEFTQSTFYVSGDSCKYTYYWTGRPLPASASDALLILLRNKITSSLLSGSETVYQLAVHEDGEWRYSSPEDANTGYSVAISDFRFGVMEVEEPVLHDDAGCTQMSFIPTSMYTKESKSISVWMKNTGTTEWERSEDYRLVSENNPVNLWGTTEVEMDFDTSPGFSRSFSFDITAPSTPGTHSIRWGMSGPNGDFGDMCVDYIEVEVRPTCGDGLINQPSEQCDGTHGTQSQCQTGSVCDMSTVDDSDRCVCETVAAKCSNFNDWVTASSHAACSISQVDNNPPHTTCVRDSDKDGLFDQQCKKSDGSILNIQ